jgi:hypothetical protein
MIIISLAVKTKQNFLLPSNICFFLSQFRTEFANIFSAVDATQQFLNWLENFFGVCSRFGFFGSVQDFFSVVKKSCPSPGTDVIILKICSP